MAGLVKQCYSRYFLNLKSPKWFFLHVKKVEYNLTTKISFTQKRHFNLMPTLKTPESSTKDEIRSILKEKRTINNVLGKSNIQSIINSGYYTDKTIYAQYLIQNETRSFLVRPDGFGKTLLLNTIYEICKGDDNRHLFKNTEIGQISSLYEWKKFPTFLFDFSKLSTISIDKFESDFKEQFEINCIKYGIKYNQSHTIGKLLWNMMEGGVKLGDPYENKVVILIDNYDFLMNSIDFDKKIINEMAYFFANLQANLNIGTKMVFVTGASKFGLGFPVLGRLRDITLNKEMNAICGFTHAELLSNYDEELNKLSIHLHISKDKLLTKLENWYGGFNFCGNTEKIYNPWSIFSAFKNKEIKPYWRLYSPKQFKTLPFRHFEYIFTMMNEPTLLAYERDLISGNNYYDLKLKTYLFQNGYLTIDGYEKDSHEYTLKITNNETEILLNKYMCDEGFNKYNYIL